MSRVRAAYEGGAGRIVAALVNDRGGGSHEAFRLRDGLAWRGTEYLEG